MKISLTFLFLSLLLAVQASPAHAQLTEQFELTASDEDGRNGFGHSVSISGDTLVVGEPYESFARLFQPGSAYVFARSGATWTEQAKLSASDAGEQEHFGASVSISGDTVLVGARDDWHSGEIRAGSAYVFVRNGTTWTQQAKLIASDPEDYDFFGWSVAISGDTALIGTNSLWRVRGGGHARRNPPGGYWLQGTEVPSAYVFVRNGTTWTQQAKLTASDGPWVAPHRHSLFGSSVSLYGDTAVVGAPGATPAAGLYDAGSAYVFVRNGTTWTQQAKLFGSGAVTTVSFGRSVSVHGGTALIGALRPYPLPSLVYVFVRTGTTWTEEATLTASSGDATDNFGISVSVDGDTALVGAEAASLPAAARAGAAYVFRRIGTTWSERAKLVDSDASVLDELGGSVAVHGDTAVVGNVEGSLGGPGSANVYCVEQATAMPRNGGSNPASYTATPPVMGGTFTGTVDLTTTGHGFALLFGFDSPASQTLAGGQVLLCSPLLGGELLNLTARPGPIAQFFVNIPIAPGLCGLSLCTQALHFGGAGPFALSNAQDLVVGL